MRTTIELDQDTAKAVEAVRRERSIGVPEAVNDLIRRGVLCRVDTPAFRQRTARLGLRVDVSNVADTLEALDGPASR